MSNTTEANDQNVINEQSLEAHREEKWKCLSRESLTCLMLSAIVIGLPIAIIIILMNLPKLSTRGDTRQQHYILLAFGFPFSLVFIVSVLYGSFRAVMYFHRGSDQSRYLQSPHLHRGFSWRHFSRRFNSRRHCNRDLDLDSDLSASSRFYSLVNQVMAQNNQVFLQNVSTTVSDIDRHNSTATMAFTDDNGIKESHSISFDGK